MSESYLKERWRAPVKRMAIKEEPGWATADTGRATQEYSARFHPDDVERIRLGYVCLKCWEPHQTPFPEQCSLCGYTMKKDQPHDFQRLYRGQERNPSAVLIEKELDDFDDRADRTFHVNKLGIIVPASLKET